MHKDGKDILWTDVVKLFNTQHQSLLAQQCRLARESVLLNSYSKVIKSLCFGKAGIGLYDLQSCQLLSKVYFFKLARYSGEKR